MNDAIDMTTHTGGGFLAGLKRSFSGGSFFVTDFTARGPGHVAFAPRFPGTILPIDLTAGTVFLDLSGEVVYRDLAPGERLLVHAGHVGVIDPTIGFDIQMVSGFKNILFGGEGLFLATLTGPCCVCRCESCS